ncbi:TetR/AcrR family transcriptional regulator [Antarctobacter heliothermus]|uniref:Transcriptional regulator, TetR family n=1 Tax=Antarctobacter heliothermus TaxID=74033 RepID=A0A239I951_9RHOB|nr:TetR/AcrR family transcriptional regulator [Antarctobacter heliothermus]SNS90105.1 transcriptional regulator, TetR family [Antarctobacter heliothermus]
MRPENRTEREAQIAEAAYAVLAEKGFGGLSMLAVAKRAKASNETMYRWYGDKTGLFRALIQRNAAQVTERLEALPPDATSLDDLGALLLDMLLSDRAVALNRAAAADPSNSLGAVLAEAGRGTVFPRLVAVFEHLCAAGEVTGPPEAAAALWVDLLVGDWQLRCVTGAMSPPGPEARGARVRRASRGVLTAR